jgi:hypothetical protein
VANESAYRNESLKSLEEERKARAADQQTAMVRGNLATVPMGGVVDPTLAGQARSSGLGSQLQHQDPILASTSFSSIADAGQKTPTLRGARVIENAGHGEQDVNLGSSAQQAAAQARQDKIDAAQSAAAERAASQATAAADRENLARVVAGLKQPGQGPQPQLFFDKDGKPHAIQFQNGVANEIKLPDNITGKTAPSTKLSSQQQSEVENYDAVLREATRINSLLKKTGLDQDNNPLASHSRAFIAQKLGVTADDPSVDQLLQNVGYLQSLALRSAAGNQRMTQNLQKIFQQHVPEPSAPGKRIAALTGELQRQLGERRADVYRLAGVTDPNVATDQGGSSGFQVIGVRDK